MRRIKPLLGGLFPVILAAVCGGLTAPGSSLANGAASSDPQVEYIAPDGEFSSLTATHSAAQKPSATFIDPETIACTLREGETTFIIQLPKHSPSDRFTFLNENVEASGELRIAVSDSALPADSPKWTQVDGIVPFAHKRLFKLSILGVDTKFVRLSFKVDGQHEDSARISDPFRSSFLAAGIDSNLNRVHHRALDLNLSTSVGALWAKQN